MQKKPLYFLLSLHFPSFCPFLHIYRVIARSSTRLYDLYHFLSAFLDIFSCTASQSKGPRSNFGIAGGREGGTISDSILGGGHKTLFLTNSL